MPPASLPRQFFERIVKSADPVAAIGQLIDHDNPLFEQDWLDFKREHPGDLKQREVDSRRTWSEFLSAFANTGGGVLVWGIDAKRKRVGTRDIDYACDVVPIQDAVGLASKLTEWQGQATNPPLSGVEIKSYTIPGKGTEGFVVCFVPVGTLKPYQSLTTSDRQYYLRGGSSNFAMDRSVLAAMFHPHSKAVFRISVDWEFKRNSYRMSNEQPKHQIWARIKLYNQGSATAQMIAFRLTWNIKSELMDMRPTLGRDFGGGDGNRTLSVDSPINPGFELNVCVASWLVTDSDLYLDEYDDSWQIRFTLFAQNQEPQHMIVQTSPMTVSIRGMTTTESVATTNPEEEGEER